MFKIIGLIIAVVGIVFGGACCLYFIINGNYSAAAWLSLVVIVNVANFDLLTRGEK